MQKIFYNAKILNLEDSFEEKEAFFVNDEKIVFVGTNKEVFEMASAETLKIDLEGKIVIPTFFANGVNVYKLVEEKISKDGKKDLIEKIDDSDENYESFKNYETYKAYFLDLQNEFLKNGITTILEIQITKPEFVFWKKISSEKLLKIDVIGYVDILTNKQILDENCVTYRSYKNGFRLAGYYIGLDGKIEEKKAWIKKPYRRSGGYNGFCDYFDEQLGILIKSAFDEKRNLFVEANGNLAVEQLLRIYSEKFDNEKLNLKTILSGGLFLEKKDFSSLEKYSIFPCFDLDGFVKNKKLIKSFFGLKFSMKNPIKTLLKNKLKFIAKTENENTFNFIKNAKLKIKSSKNAKIKANNQNVVQFLQILKNNAEVVFEEKNKSFFDSGRDATFLVLDDNFLKQEINIEKVFVKGDLQYNKKKPQ